MIWMICLLLRHIKNQIEGEVKNMKKSSAYHSPEIRGIDGKETNKLAHAGTEWVWEQYYVAYVNGFAVADTVVMVMN